MKIINKFNVGDKLKASDYDKEHHGLEFVTITSINEEDGVYYWVAPEPYLGGKIHSGYFFEDAVSYE